MGANGSQYERICAPLKVALNCELGAPVAASERSN